MWAFRLFHVVPASQPLLPATHAHPDATHLQRGITCIDVCLCSTVHAVVHACTLNRAMSRGYEATPMHRKLNRATPRDRKCTFNSQSPCTFFYKARRIDVRWPLSSLVVWHARETDNVTKQTRGKMKTEVWPETSPSTVFLPL